MNKLCLLLLLSLIGNQLLFSQRQTILYKYRNMPCAGDSIIKQQMEYINPGAAGRQITWDFRSIHQVTYVLLFHIILETMFLLDVQVLLISIYLDHSEQLVILIRQMDHQ